MADKFKLSAWQRYNLRSELKAYRQRLQYARKHGIDPSILPKPVSVTNIEANIKSKSDYDETLKKLAAINMPSLKKAQQAIVEKNQLSEYRGALIDIAGTNGKQGRFPTETKLLVKDLEGKKGEDSYQRLQSWISDNRRISDDYKRRYLQGTVTKMEEAVSAGDYEAFRVAKELNRFVDKASPLEFFFVMLTEGDNAGLRFIYNKDGQLAAQLQSILDVWTRALGGG